MTLASELDGMSEAMDAAAEAKAEGWRSLAAKHFALLAWRIYGNGGPLPPYWAEKFKAAA